jgi:hypothetical protein
MWALEIFSKKKVGTGNRVVPGRGPFIFAKTKTIVQKKVLDDPADQHPWRLQTKTLH